MADTGAEEPRPVILMLDNDHAFVASARQHLAERFELLQVATEEDVLSTSSIPDVVVVDVDSAPSGPELVERLESSEKTSDVPVILLSESAGPADRAAALDWGAADLLVKPVVWEELAASISAAVRAKDRLINLHRGAGRDRVTGLPNRRTFDQRLAEEVARSRRNGSALSLMLVDVDRMERVISRLSRPAGDRLLELLAETLRRTLRMSDALFRLDSDDFAAILPDTPIETAIIVADRMLEVVRAIRSDAAGRFHVSLESTENAAEISVSIGIAELPTGRTEEEFLARADAALERARESGGNRVWRADDPRRRPINTSALSEELTDRERTVLALIAQRRTEQDIARRMGISAGTVRSHKARIRRKLQVPPNVRLSDFAQEHLSQPHD